MVGPGGAAGSAANFKATRKEALDAEREEQRLANQAEMDSLFDKRYNGDPDLQPTMDPVQEATSLLVVSELQPGVAYAHDKSGTVSQLADCIRDRNQDTVKGLFKAAKRGGDRWSEVLDRIRTSLSLAPPQRAQPCMLLVTFIAARNLPAVTVQSGTGAAINTKALRANLSCVRLTLAPESSASEHQ